MFLIKIQRLKNEIGKVSSALAKKDCQQSAVTQRSVYSPSGKAQDGRQLLRYLMKAKDRGKSK